MGNVLIEPESLSGESVPVPGMKPWDCLARIRDETVGRPVLVWESPDGETLAGLGSVCRVDAEGPGRFEETRRRLGGILARAEHTGVVEGFPGPIAVGGFAFAPRPRSGWPGFPGASFWIPERLFWKAPGRPTIETRWTATGSDTRPRIEAETEEDGCWDRDGWIEAVRLTLDRIRDGSLLKAVLARSLVIPIDRPGQGLPILGSLREAYPGCYRFLIEDGRGNAILGASPERLVRLSGGTIRTEAVAGTQRCEPGDDVERLAGELLQSAKDRSEHQVVVRHLREALAEVAETLEAPETPEVMRLPHLLHLRTMVRARTLPDAHILDLVSRIHPTPAVAGWPRKEAMEWIGRVEPADRGWYAGPVGWMNAAGEGDFAVAIRSVAIRGRAARIFAGAGIVEGSDPGQEWGETELKMKGILDAIARD